MDRQETTTDADPLAATQESLDDRLLRRELKQRLFGRAAPVRAGRYELERRIARGGMGIVYAATDCELDREVALKLLLPGRPAGRERMIREAKAMARLSHPNVVTVHEVGTHDDRVFVAMEFVRGPTLDAWLAEPRTVPEILGVFRQAAIGLAAAHRVGLVHRDFKPANVLIGDDGWVKVADFGLAKAAAEAETATTAEDVEKEPSSTITRTGALVGTPAYMAPEQFLARPVDVTGDVFSFCVALYEALTGRRPYVGDDAQAVFDNARHERRDPLRVPGVPAPVIALVERGLAFDPRARPQSMQPFIDALEARAPVRPARRTLPLVAASAVVVAIAALVTIGGMPDEPDNAPVIAAETTEAEPEPEPEVEPEVASAPLFTCTPYVTTERDPAEARRAAEALAGIDLARASAVPAVLDASRALVDIGDRDGACDVLTGYLTTPGDRRDDEARCLFTQFCTDVAARPCPEGSERMGSAGCVLAKCGEEKERAITQACESGQAECCLVAGVAAGEGEDAFGSFTGACEGGSALACARAAGVIPATLAERDGLQPVEFRVRACRLGLQRACDLVAPDLAPPSGDVLSCMMSIGDPNECSLGPRHPEVTKAMARYLTLHVDTPGVLDGTSLRLKAKRLGFDEDTLTAIERAEQKFRENAKSAIAVCEPAVLQRPGDPEDDLQGRVSTLWQAFYSERRWGHERVEAIAQQVADERAGFADPPPLNPVEARCLRMLFMLGDTLQDHLADEIGRDRAEQLHADQGGWMGTRALYLFRSP